MTICDISPGRHMHCSKRSRAARAHSSDADGHSRPPSSRSKLIGEPSSFGEKVQACLNAASHIWEICSSSVLVQGTTPALYRNTGTTPTLIASSFKIGESTLSRRSADKRCLISSRTYAFSSEKSSVMANRTPSCLSAL